MKNILVSIIAVFALSGCFYQSVNKWDIDRAIYACNGLDNIVEIRSDALGAEGVTCKDGSSYGLSEVSIKEGNK